MTTDSSSEAEHKMDMRVSEENSTRESYSSEVQEDDEPKLLKAEDLESQSGEEAGITGGGSLLDYELSERASRTLSRRTTNAEALIEKANQTDEPMPKMGGGREYPPAIPDKEAYIVMFDGPDDPDHPQNWPTARKNMICFGLGINAMALTMGSAMYSTGILEVMQVFHIGEVTATLGTSLYVFGFASGPVLFGPISELFGRKLPLVISAFGFICFTFATATAKDIQTVMLGRFFSGFVGAAPLVVVPAAFADMYAAKTRGIAMSIFSLVVFGGPMLGPIIGGFTVKNTSLGWRWTSYLSGIIGAFGLFLVVFTFTETSHSQILKAKAEKLRRRTGNWGIRAPIEEVSLSLKEIVENNITKPVIMLFVEPILFLITLYNAFVYGLLYLFLTAIPLIFEGKYYWRPGIAELPYLSMFIGIVIGTGISLALSSRYTKAMMANGGKPVPEERLPPMMIGGVLFAGGIFWLGWGGAFGNKVHWIVPTLGCSFIGAGLVCIFLPCINYIVDCYLFIAASALAGNTLLRSAFGGVFPLFARQMFDNMKIKWASTLLGLIAVIMIPVPILFYIYGKKIREKSRFAIVL